MDGWMDAQNLRDIIQYNGTLILGDPKIVGTTLFDDNDNDECYTKFKMEMHRVGNKSFQGQSRFSIHELKELGDMFGASPSRVCMYLGFWDVEYLQEHQELVMPTFEP